MCWAENNLFLIKPDLPESCFLAELGVSRDRLKNVLFCKNLRHIPPPPTQSTSEPQQRVQDQASLERYFGLDPDEPWGASEEGPGQSWAQRRLRRQDSRAPGSWAEAWARRPALPNLLPSSVVGKRSRLLRLGFFPRPAGGLGLGILLLSTCHTVARAWDLCLTSRRPAPWQLHTGQDAQARGATLEWGARSLGLPPLPQGGGAEPYPSLSLALVTELSFSRPSSGHPAQSGGEGEKHDLHFRVLLS